MDEEKVFVCLITSFVWAFVLILGLAVSASNHVNSMVNTGLYEYTMNPKNGKKELGLTKEAKALSKKVLESKESE